MTDQTTRPFIKALRALMSEEDLSFRKLSYLTAQHRDDGPVSLAHLTYLVRDERRPTPDVMRAIALAAGKPEDYFLEYRQHQAVEQARRLVQEIGAEQVMDALRALETQRGG